MKFFAPDNDNGLGTAPAVQPLTPLTPPTPATPGLPDAPAPVVPATSGAVTAPDATDTAALESEINTLESENADLTDQLQASKAQVATLQSQLDAKDKEATEAKSNSESGGSDDKPKPEQVIEDGGKQAIRIHDADGVWFIEDSTGHVNAVPKRLVSNAFRRSAVDPTILTYNPHGYDVPPKDSSEYVSIDEIDSLVEKVTPEVEQAAEDAKKEDENRADFTVTTKTNRADAALQRNS